MDLQSTRTWRTCTCYTNLRIYPKNLAKPLDQNAKENIEDMKEFWVQKKTREYLAKLSSLCKPASKCRSYCSSFFSGTIPKYYIPLALARKGNTLFGENREELFPEKGERRAKRIICVCVWVVENPPANNPLVCVPHVSGTCLFNRYTVPEGKKCASGFLLEDVKKYPSPKQRT